LTPRINSPEGEGALGIGFVESTLVKYPWYESIWKGLQTVFGLTQAMLGALLQIIKNIFLSESIKLEVAGPVGIAVLTKQVATLGLVYVLQFAAILSINLGIINAFPFPALDGGRILFILIEKIKGAPVSQKVEQIFHTFGFLLLILLMLFITFKDIAKFIK
jgi:regulator of sigma E protease